MLCNGYCFKPFYLKFTRTPSPSIPASQLSVLTVLTNEGRGGCWGGVVAVVAVVAGLDLNTQKEVKGKKV